MQAMEIGDIERVEDTSLPGRESQLLLVALPEALDVQHRDHGDAPRPEGRDQTTLRCIFVK